jgi:hypothetical protein
MMPATELATPAILLYNADGLGRVRIGRDHHRALEVAMQQRVADVERLKTRVRKLAAGQILSGGEADACQDLALLDQCRVRIAAGYGTLGDRPRPAPRDRMIWILDGYAEIHDSFGNVTSISQGESTVLSAGIGYQLAFPQLTIYLSVETEEQA